MDDVLRFAFDVFIVGTFALIDLVMVATVCFLIKHVWIDVNETYEVLKRSAKK